MSSLTSVGSSASKSRLKTLGYRLSHTPSQLKWLRDGLKNHPNWGGLIGSLVNMGVFAAITVGGQHLSQLAILAAQKRAREEETAMFVSMQRKEEAILELLIDNSRLLQSIQRDHPKVWKQYENRRKPLSPKLAATMSSLNPTFNLTWRVPPTPIPLFGDIGDVVEAQGLEHTGPGKERVAREIRVPKPDEPVRTLPLPELKAQSSPILLTSDQTQSSPHDLTILGTNSSFQTGKVIAESEKFPSTKEGPILYGRSGHYIGGSTPTPLPYDRPHQSQDRDRRGPADSVKMMLMPSTERSMGPAKHGLTRTRTSFLFQSLIPVGPPTNLPVPYFRRYLCDIPYSFRYKRVCYDTRSRRALTLQVKAKAIPRNQTNIPLPSASNITSPSNVTDRKNVTKGLTHKRKALSPAVIQTISDLYGHLGPDNVDMLLSYTETWGDGWLRGEDMVTDTDIPVFDAMLEGLDVNVQEILNKQLEENRLNSTNLTITDAITRVSNNLLEIIELVEELETMVEAGMSESFKGFLSGDESLNSFAKIIILVVVTILSTVILVLGTAVVVNTVCNKLNTSPRRRTYSDPKPTTSLPPPILPRSHSIEVMSGDYVPVIELLEEIHEQRNQNEVIPINIEAIDLETTSDFLDYQQVLIGE